MCFGRKRWSGCCFGLKEFGTASRRRRRWFWWRYVLLLFLLIVVRLDYRPPLRCCHTPRAPRDRQIQLAVVFVVHQQLLPIHPFRRQLLMSQNHPIPDRIAQELFSSETSISSEHLLFLVFVHRYRPLIDRHEGVVFQHLHINVTPEILVLVKVFRFGGRGFRRRVGVLLRDV
jgi:hypothetical protein